MPWHPLRSDAAHRFRCCDALRTGKGEMYDEMWGLHSSGAGDVAVSTNQQIVTESDDWVREMTWVRSYLDVDTLDESVFPSTAILCPVCIYQHLSNSCSSRCEVPFQWHAIVNHPPFSETPIRLRFEVPLFCWNRSREQPRHLQSSSALPVIFQKDIHHLPPSWGCGYAVALQMGGAWWPGFFGVNYFILGPECVNILEWMALWQDLLNVSFHDACYTKSCRPGPVPTGFREHRIPHSALSLCRWCSNCCPNCHIETFLTVECRYWILVALNLTFTPSVNVSMAHFNVEPLDAFSRVHLHEAQQRVVSVGPS